MTVFDGRIINHSIILSPKAREYISKLPPTKITELKSLVDKAFELLERDLEALYQVKVKEKDLSISFENFVSGELEEVKKLMNQVNRIIDLNKIM